MSEPTLNTDQLEGKDRKKSSKLGYAITRTKEAVEEAQLKGRTMVKEVKMSSLEIRGWAHRTHKETRKMLTKLKRDLTRAKTVKRAKGPDKRIWEIAYWENEISRRIRIYFGDVSGMMNRLKKLNPPLKSKELDPYLVGILNERRYTLTKLEPLTHIVGELNQVKSQLYIEETSKYRYHPQI